MENEKHTSKECNYDFDFSEVDFLGWNDTTKSARRLQECFTFVAYLVVSLLKKVKEVVGGTNEGE